MIYLFWLGCLTLLYRWTARAVKIADGAAFELTMVVIRWRKDSTKEEVQRCLRKSYLRHVQS